MLQNKISRQLLIINILLDNPHGISKNELVSFIEKKFELLNQRFKYLNLAFNRDLKELREDFGLDIPYSKKHKIYTLNDYTINDSRIELLLNSFKIFSSLVNSSGLPEYIIPEKRKSNGIENFSILTEAINKKSIIEFYYFKYDINVTETKTVKPFALKESKNRWYLIGFYENTQEYRTFGLDRINNVTLTDRTYKKSPSIAEINDYFRDSFAMFTDEKTEFVKLSFDIRDGNYIKSYPIHTSQQINFIEKENRYEVTLNIKITLDFIMELLSRSWSVEVIEPLHLRKKLASIFQEALKRNK